MYEILKERLGKLIDEHHLGNEHLRVKSRVLSVKEAIGTPDRNDYPIQKGKESLIEATFLTGRGQAFTDMPREYDGTLDAFLNLKMELRGDYAVFIAILNAVLNHLGLVDSTIHCKDKEPKECAVKLVEYIKENYGKPRIALIGLQPAMLSALSKHFEIRVADLDIEMIGSQKEGILIENGETMTQKLVTWCDVIVATGSSAANGTLPNFIGQKPVVFYGTTIAGLAYLNEYDRFCPESK